MFKHLKLKNDWGRVVYICCAAPRSFKRDGKRGEKKYSIIASSSFLLEK